MIDRLTLNDEKIVALASSTKVVASLVDPVGAKRVVNNRLNGTPIRKMGVILGVFLMVVDSH
jgi:glutamate-5-semialdehyde dehydrogenase